MSNVTPLEPRRVTKRKKGEPSTYDTVIAAAHVLLEREGATALTIRALADEAVVAPMTIYNRFINKDGIVDRLANDGFDELGRRLIAADDGTNTLERLRRGAEVYRSLARERPALYSVMFEQAIPEYSPSEACMLAAGSSFGVLVDHVREGQGAGDIVDGDPVEIAERVWALLHGLVTLELRGIGFVDDRDSHFRNAVETMIRGLQRVQKPEPATRRRRPAAAPQTNESPLRPLKPAPPRA